MVTSATSLTGNGLRDWLIQRVSALVIGAYSVFILFYIGLHPHLDYSTWQQLFSHLSIRIFTLVTLFCVLVHTWIGMWTVFTDYIKPSCLRITLICLLILVLFGYLFCGIEIIWGL